MKQFIFYIAIAVCFSALTPKAGAIDNAEYGDWDYISAWDPYQGTPTLWFDMALAYGVTGFQKVQVVPPEPNVPTYAFSYTNNTGIGYSDILYVWGGTGDQNRMEDYQQWFEIDGHNNHIMIEPSKIFRDYFQETLTATQTTLQRQGFWYGYPLSIPYGITTAGEEGAEGLLQVVLEAPEQPLILGLTWSCGTSWSNIIDPSSVPLNSIVVGWAHP